MREREKEEPLECSEGVVGEMVAQRETGGW